MTKTQKQKPRVLVVDDDHELSEAVSSGLRDAGFSTERLESGRDAATRIEAGEYDALVTDLRMLDVEGLDLCARRDAFGRTSP